MRRAIIKLLTISVAFVLVIANLAGCSGGSDPGEQGDETASKDAAQDKITVVATIFPQYDWCRNIIGDVGDNIELDLLISNGVDLHSYQPTAADIALIKDCDVLIYAGGESDGWIEDALRDGASDGKVVINMLEAIGDRGKAEEIIEGMEAEDEHEDSEDADEHEHEDDADEIEYDEHVWLSLKNATLVCGEISEALAGLDPEHQDAYRSNAAEYIDKIVALDKEYSAAIAESRIKTILFGDRFPFRYMVDDYGLEYYAAFAGCSAESEASFETIRFLSDKVDELDLKYVLVTDGRDDKIARTVIENTAGKDQKILMMDSLQSVNRDDIADGKTYLAVMEDNLTVLKEALN